ncbi:MAG: hypothetical protein ACJASB_000257 [Shewanella psychromarinicola]|jgi:hypothetical protein|uniref:hypothetical protein n=1 Tax=Shewanella psychromarinicola TaxID=2487742 RepID=UPI003EEF23CB
MVDLSRNVHANTDESSVWGNETAQVNESAKIDFNEDMTPFIDPQQQVVDDSQLHAHQQRVANKIKLQLMGVTQSEHNLAAPGMTEIDAETETAPIGSVVNKLITRIMTSTNAMIIVVTVHVLLIIFASIYWKVDVGGLLDIPLTDAASRNQAKPLPPLQSYLITQAEYDKLVERANLKSNATNNTAIIDVPVTEVINNDVVQPPEKAISSTDQRK